MFLPAGKLRRRVQIQVPITTRIAQGGFVIAWAILRTVYAQVQPVTSPNNPQGRSSGMIPGNESLAAGKLRGQMTQVITTRAMPEKMKPTFRLVEGSMIYNVISVLLVEAIKHELRWNVRENVTEPVSPDAVYDVIYNEDGYPLTDSSGEYVAS